MTSPTVRYQKLGQSYTAAEGDVYTPLQFAKPKPKIPWRAIRTAAILFAIGSILIVVGSLLLAGYIDEKYRSEGVLFYICVNDLENTVLCAVSSDKCVEYLVLVTSE